MRNISMMCNGKLLGVNTEEVLNAPLSNSRVRGKLWFSVTASLWNMELRVVAFMQTGNGSCKLSVT